MLELWFFNERRSGLEHVDDEEAGVVVERSTYRWSKQSGA
jgi:hypothetical protein